MVIGLPQLVILVLAAVLFCVQGQWIQKPVFSAFFTRRQNFIDDFAGGIFFEITHYIHQVQAPICFCDHVNMIAHDNVSKHLKAFAFLAKLQAVNDNIFIRFSRKNINPAHYGRGEKIQALRVSIL